MGRGVFAFGCRAGARLEKLNAGPAPRAGDFSLLVQRKVTKRKHTRSLAAQKRRGALRSSPHRGRCATRHATVDGVTQTVLAHIPPVGLRCSASSDGTGKTRQEGRCALARGPFMLFILFPLPPGEIPVATMAPEWFPGTA